MVARKPNSKNMMSEEKLRQRLLYFRKLEVANDRSLRNLIHGNFDGDIRRIVSTWAGLIALINERILASISD